MTDRIKKILISEGIENYLINETETEDCELYFVRRRLDQKRAKHTHKCSVSIYRDSVRETKRMRGAAEVLIFSDMDDNEIRNKLAEAYRCAQYSYAIAYPLCEPSEAHAKAVTATETEASSPDLDKSAEGYAKAIFRHDTDEKTYVNCAEIFCSRTLRRTSNSRGVDVRHTEYRCDGEIVVTSKDGEDSELFDYFSYTGEQYEALSERVRGLLCAVHDRARATRSLPSGEYSLIVEGDACRELFGYYLWKADAKNVHTGYSQAKLGDALSAPDSVGANIVCEAVRPFSREGIPSVDMPLIQNGRLAGYVGDMRFCSYIGAKPTGEYERIAVKPGNISLAEMKKEPYLHVVSFSDFQFDPLDGYFGGEIRLAYLYDGTCVRTVTGGSVSSNISKLRDSAVACSELYESYNYSGPRALRINAVTVSGSKKSE